jgi:hypothetical protein
MYSGIRADPDGDRVVIYRRSPKSITMRCNKSEGMQTACDRVFRISGLLLVLFFPLM